MSFAGTGLPPEDRSGESDRERIECLFGEALDLDPGDREEFVRSACAGNDAVLRSVLELLKAHEQATGFLERPALHPQSAWSQTQTIETSPWSARALSFIEGQIVGGRFRILSFIDQGGMGEVYSALDLHLQQPVALKTIRPTIAARPEVIERFKREVKQSLRVTHLNVCRVHQIACHQDQNGQQVWFLTMELLEGATLKRDLAETGLCRLNGPCP